MAKKPEVLRNIELDALDEDLQVPDAELVPRTIEPSFRMRAHIGTLLADAYTIVTEELRMLREKVQQGLPLNPSEAQKFTKYTEALTKLAREEREQEKHADPSKLSDEELLLQAERAKQLLGKGEP